MAVGIYNKSYSITYPAPAARQGGSQPYLELSLCICGSFPPVPLNHNPRPQQTPKRPRIAPVPVQHLTGSRGITEKESQSHAV